MTARTSGSRRASERMRNAPWRCPRRAVLAAALCLLGSGSLHAQTTTASVGGSVKDGQAGVLPGAVVTLASDTQGTVQKVVTDGLGHFLFAYVRPDTYTLQISLSGFRRVERRGVVVNANDRLAAGTITLEVGRVEETVLVPGPSPDIQARGGERGLTLPSEAIQNIGINGRNVYALVGLAPGVVAVGDAASVLNAFAVNGQRQGSNNLTVDGVANIDTGSNGGSMATTNIDAVAELKVLTTKYQAEYGRSVGLQIQVVTKSGSRAFTGTGYWYGRRSEWNANSWLNNRSGTPKPDTSRNDQGYALGGPVFIPGRFNTDRKKLFFFWSQEFQRRQDPNPAGETRATVPTELERKGDFSQSVDANGSPYPYIRDYTTGLPCTSANTSGCFRDGDVLGRIPADRLYAPTLAALSIYPLPNAPGNVGYNYASRTPSRQPRREELARFDYVPSDTWRLTARYMQSSENTEWPYGGANVPPTGQVDTVQGRSDRPGRNWMVSATHVFASAASLEISAGSAHNDISVYTANPQLTRAGAGMSSLPMLFPDALQGDMVPGTVFAGGRVRSPAQITLTGSYPYVSWNTTYDVNANVTRMMGSHAVKGGVYYQRSLKNAPASIPFNGVAAFNNDGNNPFDSTHPYANAALGIYTTFTQASGYAVAEWRYSNVEWYLQDTWRVFDDVTLDGGVRFYYLTPQWDVSQRAANFLPEQYDPSQAVVILVEEMF